MRRRLGLAAAVAAHAVAAAGCGYPDFQFGAGGGTGGSGATTSSTGSGAPCTVDHLVISEIRSRGLKGASDEFVELYNPTGTDVPLDFTWALQVRTAAFTALPAVHWTGSTGTIPAHGHFLIAGSSYVQKPSPDDMLTQGITDAASITLFSGVTQVDSVCYHRSTLTLGYEQNLGYPCEGAPVFNPHDDTTNSDDDKSLERLPGGAAGNCTDTNDNASDFVIRSPATPGSSVSPG